MTRQFRPYGKKRGRRRTGSRRLGGFGEALFFLFFLGVGAAGLTFMLSRFLWPEWRANRHFVEHQCSVLKTRVASRQGANGLQFRPDILVQYEVDGQTFQTWTYDVHRVFSGGRDDKQMVIDRFEIAGKHPCWYDPLDPNTVILVKGYSGWMWLLLLLPGSFMIIGTVGVARAVLQSITSAERRAALAQKASHLDLFEDPRFHGGSYPNVPRMDNVTDSPGTRLAYRLPVEAAAGWTLFGMFLLCLLWNAIVVWAGIRWIGEHLSGRGSVLSTLVVVPFALAGVGLGYHFFRHLLVTTGVGASRLEISGHPLYPGKSYDLFISQSGRVSVKSLEAVLVCEEEATFRQGTDTRTRRQCVFRQTVYRRDSFEIRPGTPFEDLCKIPMPDDAMHSFQSDHNDVKWKLVVTADIAGWPDYQRSFPLIVHPGSNQHA